jgi:hypothetical protein
VTSSRVSPFTGSGETLWEAAVLFVFVVAYYVVLATTLPPMWEIQAVFGFLAFGGARWLSRRWGRLNAPGKEPIAVLMAAFFLLVLPAAGGPAPRGWAFVAAGIGVLGTEGIWAVSRYPSLRRRPGQRSIVADLRWGVGWGIGMAVIFSLYALGVFVVFSITKKHNLFADVTLPLIAGCYFAGGIVGGCIAGVLRPAARRPLGAMAMGALVAFPVYEAVALIIPLLGSDIRTVTFREQLLIGLVCAILVGPPAALSMRTPYESS